MISGGEYAAVTGLQLGAIESANHFFSPCGVVKFLLEHGQSWKHCRCLTLDLGVPSLLDVLRCTAKISSVIVVENLKLVKPPSRLLGSEV